MRKKLLVFLILILLIPVKTNAASVRVSLDCPSGSTINAQIKCKVLVNSDIAVTGLAAKYNFNSNFSYVSFSAANGFSVYSSSANGFAVGNTSGKTGNFTIGTITLKLLKAGTFSLTGLDASDINDGSYSPSNASDSVKILSSVNTLTSLSISKGTLSPSFNTNTLSYKATVDDDNVTINATKTDSTSSISGTGSKNLNYGANTFNITVTSESGVKKVYKIVITRPDNRSTSNTLKTLSLSEGTINFQGNTTDYTINVSNKVTSIDIGATLADSKSSFVSGNGPRTIELKLGENAVAIQVKAENGTIRTYTLKIIRAERELSTNKNVKGVVITNHPIIFDNNVQTYEIVLDQNEAILEFDVSMEDPLAEYEIKNNTDLKDGSVVTVTAKSENGETQDYTFNIKKEVPKQGTNIKDLIIGFIIGFILSELICIFIKRK